MFAATLFKDVMPELSNGLIPEPSLRTLRIFAFDPSVSSQFDTASIGEIEIKVPWEPDIEKGPVGEYIEVVDVDPASGACYHPVDLNHPWLLAQNGLAPSETNPQFHQQMVYAVAMATIGHFERALGRVALWSSHRNEAGEDVYVKRLRIYPHALRDRNAFYSPTKKALLFGYFPVSARDSNNTPGTLVFTCLSHDIVAHETTHALLDGVHPRFNEPMNIDVLAFHEAFADIVALFQHFSYPGVLRHQIARTRGNLAGESLLAQLAQQFGRAAGRGGALRDALGQVNPLTNVWEPVKPDVHALDRVTQPHGRGAILVAAVFGAFLRVYRARTADLYRIASDGTGVLREGEIHPDLSARLASEAARTAQHVLQMCIRGIDYCPPVGITFGDYLRGVVSADYDLNAEESASHRLAFLDSFRQWGIHPRNMRSVSVDSLLWPTGKEAMDERNISMERSELDALLTESVVTQQADRPHMATRGPVKFSPWNLETDRYKTWKGMDNNCAALWAWLVKGKGKKLAEAIGIVLGGSTVPGTVFISKSTGGPAVEVHAVRTAQRRSARGALITELVVEITQRRRGYFDPQTQKNMDAKKNIPREERGDFIYRAGCTLLINPSDLEVRRVIRTAGTIIDDEELERQRRFLTEGGLEPGNAFDSAGRTLRLREPFAMLHRDSEGM